MHCHPTEREGKGSSGERISDINSGVLGDASATYPSTSVRFGTVTELLQKPSRAWPPPSGEVLWSKPKEPHPQPQEPQDRCRFWLHNTFSETCFCFLSQCCNVSLQERLGWVPRWSLSRDGGRGRGRPRPLQMLYFWEARTHERVLSCATSSPVCTLLDVGSRLVTLPFSPIHPRLTQQTQRSLV